MGKIVIKNFTPENIRIAIFKKNYRRPALRVIAWEIIAPPQKGQTTLSIPSTYEIFANYPGPHDSKEDPYAGNQTPKLTLNQSTGRFIISSTKTDDGMARVAKIAQSFQNLIAKEIRILNRSSFGVWGHICQGGADVYPPEVIPPGSVMIEEVNPTLYLAIVNQYVSKGARLAEAEISSTTIPILVGQTATINGSVWTGYGISVSDL